VDKAHSQSAIKANLKHTTLNTQPELVASFLNTRRRKHRLAQ